MLILGIAAQLPSKSVTNQAVLDLVQQHSAERFDGDLPRTLKAVGKLLDQGGFQTRRWLAEGEHPMALMEAAFERALAQSGLARDDIDLLIYAGVTRGFIEPANSTFVAKALGLRCRNFDVVDACMGWVSAMDIVNDRMQAGSVRHAAIVNMEFGMVAGGPCFPKNFELGDADELAYKHATLTMGEAVTVTLVGQDAPGNFRFSYVDRPDLSDLCTISLPGWKFFCNASDGARIRPTGDGYQFNSDGKSLHHLGEAEIVEAFHAAGVAPADLDVVFTHTSSPSRWRHFCRLIGVEDKLHPIGHRTGNMVTASIPLGIVDAVEQGVLKRGQRCLAWVGAAGMSFCAATFHW